MKRSFSVFARFFLAPIIKKFFIEKVEGEENIPQESNFIIASNHQSYFDHFFVAFPLKDKLEKAHFIGKMESPLHPLLFGLIYFFAETIAVNRKSKGRRMVLKRAIEYLKKGEIIIIYPEGGRNGKKTLRKGKTGVAELALKTGVPILPIGTLNQRNGWKKVIKIGKLIDTQDILKERDTFTPQEQEYELLLRRVTDKVMKAISQLCGKRYPYS